MKKYKAILLIVLTLALQNIFYSCKKDNAVDDQRKQGKVIDAITGQPVANAYVALFASTGNILMPGSKLVASTFTDASGNFKFDESLEGDEVQATKKQYFDSKRYALDDHDYKLNKSIVLTP